MAYLLLWAGIERYTALSYGPGLDPSARLKQFGDDSRFKEALAHTVERGDKVFDARDPTAAFHLDPARPASSSKYFYQVRSNLSHRGKGAWSDGEKVRLALVDLLQVFERMLEKSDLSAR